jgi:hypothetical protein
VVKNARARAGLWDRAIKAHDRAIVMGGPRSAPRLREPQHNLVGSRALMSDGRPGASVTWGRVVRSRDLCQNETGSRTLRLTSPSLLSEGDTGDLGPVDVSGARHAGQATDVNAMAGISAEGEHHAAFPVGRLM